MLQPCIMDISAEDDNEAVPIKEFKPSSQKSRVVLGDLDVNRPVSPGRKVPKAFVATGLTSLQVVSLLLEPYWDYLKNTFCCLSPVHFRYKSVIPWAKAFNFTEV